MRCCSVVRIKLTGGLWLQLADGQHATPMLHVSIEVQDLGISGQALGQGVINPESRPVREGRSVEGEVSPPRSPQEELEEQQDMWDRSVSSDKRCRRG